MKVGNHLEVLTRAEKGQRLREKNQVLRYQEFK